MILEGEHKSDVRHYVVVHSFIINFICRLSVINILYFKPGFFRGSKYCTAMQKQDSEYYLMPRLGSCAVPNRSTHVMASLLRGVGRKQEECMCECRQTKINFKRLSHTIMRLGQPSLSQVEQQDADTRES